MMMIRSKRNLYEYLNADVVNYKIIALGLKRFYSRLCADPISDQYYIWKYIKTLRYLEYHTNSIGFFHKMSAKYWLWKLRKLSYKTGFQIPPNTIGKGLTIWHWGNIIINPRSRLGDCCTLYPDVLIGHKTSEEPAPVIGNNVFIGSGAKIIGKITIGNNVTIAPNAVVIHDIPDDVIVGGVPAKIIKKKRI